MTIRARGPRPPLETPARLAVGHCPYCRTDVMIGDIVEPPDPDTQHTVWVGPPARAAYVEIRPHRIELYHLGPGWQVHRWTLTGSVQVRDVTALAIEHVPRPRW